MAFMYNEWSIPKQTRPILNIADIGPKPIHPVWKTQFEYSHGGLGAISISDKTSYHKISQSLEAARLVV